MNINKMILSALVALFSIVNVSFTTNNMYVNPAIEHAKRFEVLYAQDALREITSNNPARDIILLRRHIEFLETEKNELTKFKLGRFIGLSICILNGVAGIIGTSQLSMQIILKNVPFFNFNVLKNLIVGIVLTTISFELTSKLKQEKAAKLDAIEKNINLDNVIITQLRQIKKISAQTIQK